MHGFNGLTLDSGIILFTVVNTTNGAILEVYYNVVSLQIVVCGITPVDTLSVIWNFRISAF